VSFEYGTVSLGTIALVLANPVPNPIGPIAGQFSSDGTIRITVPRNLVGGPIAGDLLGGMYGRTFPAASAARTFRSTTALDSTPLGTYAAAGNAACAPRGQTTCLDDDDARIAYSNGWHRQSAASASGGHYALHLGNNPSDGVKVPFQVPSGQTGTFLYFYATSTKGGAAQVYVDGVAKGSVSFAGSQGDTRSPQFGPVWKLAGLAPGAHTFELRSITGAAYVDGFCIASGTSSGQPASGPGTTSSATTTLSSAQQLVGGLALPAGTQAVAIAATAPVPIRILLLSSAGKILATADNSSGFAVIEAPASAGAYLLKTVNLSAGPVDVWTAVTPFLAR
jgi:hypothetical protein